MKTNFWLQAITSLFLVMALTLSVASPALAASVDVQAIDEGIISDPQTGALAFIGTQSGLAAEALSANSAASSPAETAAAFLSTYADQLGLSDVASELTLVKTITGTGGRSTLRYQQNYHGISVLGGEVLVNVNDQGALLSLTAKTSPHLQMNTEPTLTGEDAIAAAAQAIAKYNNLDAASLTAGTAKLQIYDSRLLSPDGVAPRLVWNTVVSSPANDINEVVLVDANNGAVALHYPSVIITSSQSASAEDSDLSTAVLGSPQIGIYNLNNTEPEPGDPAWPGTFICDQSSKPACDSHSTDAANAYLNALDAYNFLQNHLGIDSLDNAGTSINGTINYKVNYKKVAWLTQIHVAAYGSGYTGADDMAGHAIGFGLLEYSDASGLLMAGQPGAIARSMNDMWGEFIDQTNGRGNDAAGVKWVIGEDWPDGAQRNMSNPALAPFNDPDKMTSANYYFGPDENIGTFKNAGVNNKAVFLMTNGGTFNGKTVTALGITKVARIYYEVEKHLLASASTYFDLYYAVKQACHNLRGTAGITVQNCDQVVNALDAVEMNKTNSSAVVASYCPVGKSKGNPSIFSDSMENGLAQWTFPSTPWTQVLNQATNGLYHLQGPEPGNVSQAIAQMTNAVTIPSGYPVYLFFEHWFNFEVDGPIYNDGGFLQYTTDSVTWNNAGPLYASGQNYGGTLFTGLQNPWGGQSAFVAGVRNYVSTTYNLSSLAGQQVKFRWIVASDNAVAGDGWYVDNIQIYRCVGLPSVPTLVAPPQNALKTTYTGIVLDWSNAVPDLDHYIVEVSTVSTFATILYQASSTTSIHTIATPLTPNRKYFWRVRAYNYANDANGWSAVRYFRTALAPPTLIKPIGTAPSLKPIFDWSNVAGAQGYTIQVSRFANFTSPVINVTIASPTSTYKATTSLLTKKKYYWRVRTNGVNGPSAWKAGSFTAP